MKDMGYLNAGEHSEDICQKYKLRQDEMIRRHDAEYTEKDWVLWIVPDFFYNRNARVITGTIEVKRNGEPMEIPVILRNPYPNKKIRQLSMKSGRRVLYGIPLVFRSFEELSGISDITIRWDVYELMYRSITEIGVKEPPLPHLETVLVQYHLIFRKDNQNPHSHIFTVFSNDSACLADIKGYEEKAKLYYDEFDIAEVICGKITEEGPAVTGIRSLKKNNKRVYTRAEMRFINEYHTAVRDIEEECKLLEKTQSDTLYWDMYCFEKTESLTAASMANLMASPCFGFAD